MTDPGLQPLIFVPAVLPAVFPTQIHQAMLATEHIIASGVHQSNLHLMGDSAGGNVILGLLSHMLHPLDSIRPMISPALAPFGSVYLMSPWVCLQSSSASIINDAGDDVLSGISITQAGTQFMEAVPADRRTYVQPVNAPEGWFDALDSIVGRMLMTTGNVDLFRDDISQLSETLSKIKSKYTFFVQANGYHDDPIISFMAGAPLDQLGTLPPMIVQWFAASIKASE